MLFGSKKRKEIDNRIESLRANYKLYAQKYGKNYFNLLKFEERLSEALKSRMDLEIFLKAEEEAFDELVKEVTAPKVKKEKLSERPDSFTRKVDKMLEEYNQRISKYPILDFHTYSDDEIKYLFGAIKFFYDKIFPYLESVYTTKNVGVNLMKEFSIFYNYLNYFARPSKTGYSKKIEDFIMKIKYSSEKDVEKEYRNIFIETAKFFFDLRQFLSSTLERVRIINNFFIVDSSIFGKPKLKYQDFVEFTIKWIDQFLYDFRLKDLV